MKEFNNFNPMNTKIQELTDIIYNEGVAKGQAQADEILAQAQEQAQKIVADARNLEDVIIIPFTTANTIVRSCGFMPPRRLRP